jgi:hypothetical protein
MTQRWPAGTRIGVRLGRQPASTTAHAVLSVDGAAVDARSVSFTGLGERSLVRMLRALRARAPSGVESVTWEVSDLLDPASFAQPVAALRIVPRQPVSSALHEHPSPLVRSLLGRRAVIGGGHDLFGVELAEPQVRAAVREARAAHAAGYTALAVTAAGATGCAEHEARVAERVLDAVPELKLSLSHQVGGYGVVQREAATVLSAALQARAATLTEWCERVTAAVLSRPACGFVTGDGGRVPAERLREFPVLGIGASAAAALVGTAMLGRTPDATVILADRAGLRVGQVRAGVPHAASDIVDSHGVRLSTPQVVLSPVAAYPPPAAGGPPDEATPRTATLIASMDQAAAPVAGRLAQELTAHGATLAESDADLVALGATATDPSAWLDLVVSADTPDELERVRSLIEHRARTLVAAYGAQPGSERVVGSALVPLSFLRSGSYRVVVRVTGSVGRDP